MLDIRSLFIIDHIKKKMIAYLVAATWLLSIVFGVAFWALLFYGILLR